MICSPLTARINIDACTLFSRAYSESVKLYHFQAEYQKRYDALTERFNTAKKNLADIEAEISRKELARSSIRQFLATLGKQKDLVATFDSVQFQSLVDFITVYSKDDIRVTFKNGIEIKA